jgi:methylisocitrate lyase
MSNHRSARLRHRLDRPGITIAPAVYDCLTARLAEQAGFEIAFTSGFGMAATMLGCPDIGLLTASEMLDRLRHICRAVAIPVIADADTGYGNPLNVIRTVEEAVAAGAAGIILEDQEWPKRCGHFEGKRVIARNDHVQKIRAALRARADSGLVIVARTDARAVLGLDEAIERGRAYAEAGADVIFVEAPQSRDELMQIASRLSGVPLFANIIEGGKTPALTARELEEMGYKLCAFALSGLLAATRAIRDCFQHLREHGTTGAMLDPHAFQEFANLIQLQTYKNLELEFADPDTASS